MRKLLFIGIIITFLSPCIWADEEFDRRYYQNLYGMSKEEYDAQYEEIRQRIEDRDKAEREEERHQERMKELRRIKEEVDYLRGQQEYYEVQRQCEDQ